MRLDGETVRLVLETGDGCRLWRSLRPGEAQDVILDLTAGSGDSGDVEIPAFGQIGVEGVDGLVLDFGQPFPLRERLLALSVMRS